MAETTPITLNLHTKRQIRESTRTTPGSIRFLTHVVMAVEHPDQEQLVRQGYDLDGTEKQWPLTLPDRAAARFAAFYGQTLANSKPPRYECHSMTHFMYGPQDGIHLSNRIKGRIVMGPLVQPEDPLYEGQAYGLIDRTGHTPHSFIGTCMPSMSLGILGPQDELALTPTPNLCEVFDAIGIRPVYYDSHPGAFMHPTAHL